MKKSLLVLLILLTAYSVSAKGYMLKWNASEGADGYVVYYSSGQYADNELYQKDITNVTEIELNDLNIAVGIEYDYYVKAYNNHGISEPSEVIKFTRPPFQVGDDNLPSITITIPNGVSSIIINRE